MFTVFCSNPSFLTGVSGIIKTSHFEWCEGNAEYKCIVSDMALHSYKEMIPNKFTKILFSFINQINCTVE